jgi:molybdopterin biosynthesis enzyme MoaB
MLQSAALFDFYNTSKRKASCKAEVTDMWESMTARLLYARGVDLVRVEMVPDVKEDIISTVRSLSERVGPTGFVFTSGGIGVRLVEEYHRFANNWFSSHKTSTL